MESEDQRRTYGENTYTKREQGDSSVESTNGGRGQ